MKKHFGYIVLVFFLSVLQGQAQQNLKIQRITGEINFDGIVDEIAWTQLDTLPMIMQSPVFKGTPQNRSHVFLGYNDEYFWIGAKMFVSDPGEISAASKKRDEMSGNSDFFGLVIDSYNDNENGLAFLTTPEGLRSDVSVSGDAATEQPLNPDWNTFWDVLTSKDENGWYCEMRIPFSSLRFQTFNGLSEMGIIVWRWTVATNEMVTYPSIDPKYGMMAAWKPSLAQTLIFEGISSKKPLYFSPYVLGGHTNDYSLNDEESAYINKKEFTGEIGGDIKYSITSNLTLDLTLNTDFAQVEADDQQINLTRFSLFFPEKRMFFQERASIFSFNLGGSNDMFYSRRIGLDDDGNPVRIYGGARLYGRMGKWEMGFLNMQTAKAGKLPSENFGILRMRKQVINPNSYIGGIVTSRLGSGGEYNFAFGLDGIFRIFGDDYVSFKMAQSNESEVGTELVSLNPSLLGITWERRSQKGLGYDVSYFYSGENFNPGMGFLIRDDFQMLRSKVLWGWLPEETSNMYSFNINYLHMHFTDVVSGKLQSLATGPGWEFQTRKFLIGMIQLKYMKEFVEEEFSFSDDAVVPVGDYKFYGIEGMMLTPPSNKLYAEMMLEAGQFYDGSRFSYTISPYLNLSSSVQISGTYQLDAIGFKDRDQEFINHIARLKFQYMYSTKLSASSFVQYNTSNAGFIVNFRLRYNPQEGNDFYLVFNEIRNMNPELEIPHLPQMANRTILLKYTHTFRL